MRLLIIAALAPLFCGETIAAAPPAVSTVYTPYRFAASEGWKLTSAGNPGDSRLEGSRLVLDFTRGASWIGISPPDRVILGNVSKIRIRIQGPAAGHPVHLFVRTHFMTFHKVAPPAARTDSEIAFDAPPGPGWQWANGENDGRIHGPLRLGEIRFEAGDKADHVQLRLTDIAVEGSQPANKLCVMTAGHNGEQFSAQLRCLGDAPLPGQLSWTFRDWDGHELSQGHHPIVVPAHGEPFQTAVTSALPENRKFIEAEFQAAIPGQEIASVRPCWTSGQPPQTDSQVRPESPFGMGIYLDRFQGDDLEHAARLARDAGVKWTREGFNWGRIEPRPGQFDWSYYDGLVGTARRYGISVYGLLSGWAPWTKPYSPEGIEAYTAFLKELVRHYRADIHHWEIWNEPNIFFWQGPREMYAELLRKSYAAVKQADPNAQVLGMSTSGIDYSFIARTMALDAPFDILTIHPYRKVLDDRALINELSIVSRLVQGRPVWITEFGWTTLTPHNTLAQDFAPFSERQQAALLARTYLCMLASGIRTNISWYDFRDDGDDPLYFENEMGILHRDFTPKPAYWTYATLSRVLKDRKFAGQVDAGNKGVFAYRFTGEGKTVIAIWSAESTKSITLPVTGNQITLVNAIGESRGVSPGAVRIDLVEGTPVYLVVD
jgi:hypothetical protein